MTVQRVGDLYVMQDNIHHEFPLGELLELTLPQEDNLPRCKSLRTKRESYCRMGKLLAIYMGDDDE